MLAETTASQAQPRSPPGAIVAAAAAGAAAKPSPDGAARSGDASLSQQGLRQLRVGLETQLASHERARAAAAEAIDQAQRRADDADETAEQTVAALARRTLELQKARIEIAELRVAHRQRDEAYGQLTQRVEGLVAQLDAESQNALVWRADITRLQSELEEARAEARKAQAAAGMAHAEGRQQRQQDEEVAVDEPSARTADSDALLECRVELARLREESATQALRLEATQEELDSAREHAEQKSAASTKEHEAHVAELRAEQQRD